MALYRLMYTVPTGALRIRRR